MVPIDYSEHALSTIYERIWTSQVLLSDYDDYIAWLLHLGHYSLLSVLDERAH